MTTSVAADLPLADEPEAVVSERARFVERTRAAAEADRKLEPFVPGAMAGGVPCSPPGTPHTVFADRGEGCFLWDADGNRMLDFVAGDWTMVVGHCNAAVTEAVVAQLRRGVALCAPDPELVLDVVSMLRERLPSIDRMRFTASASEAVMLSTRIAKVITGRQKIAKARGAYHGTYDISLIANGKHEDPSFVPPGLIPGTAESTVLLEYNDVDQAVETIRAAGDELAGVIIEPIHATNGMVPATPEYLRALREETRAGGSVLIFDETVTFPVTRNGAQGLYEVTPDLTTLGKTIGGGMPLGAFGGRADLMGILDPRRYTAAAGILTTSPVRHGSTLAGTVICLASAKATLEQLTPEAHARLTELGDFMRRGIDRVGEELGVSLRATGVGHLFALHWNSDPIADIRVATSGNRRIVHFLNLFLYNHGYYLMPNGMGIVSLPMTTTLLAGFHDALREIVSSGIADGWIEA